MATTSSFSAQRKEQLLIRRMKRCLREFATSKKSGVCQKRKVGTSRNRPSSRIECGRPLSPHRRPCRQLWALRAVLRTYVTPEQSDPVSLTKEYAEMLARLCEIKDVWCLPKVKGQ